MSDKLNFATLQEIKRLSKTLTSEMNSHNHSLNDRYSLRSSHSEADHLPPMSMPSQLMPISTSSRYRCNSDVYSQMVPVSSTTSNLTELEAVGNGVSSGHSLSYITQDYFPSPSFSPVVVSSGTRPASADLSAPAQPTYTSLMPGTLHMSPAGLMDDVLGGSRSFCSDLHAASPASPSGFMETFVRNSTSAPLQRIVGSLTSRLPELHTGGTSSDAAQTNNPMVSTTGVATYLTSQAQPHMTLVSPAYSPSSCTTQGSNGKQLSHLRSSGANPDEKIGGAFKSRSKKESHNRIERRRRDYINSQITRLSGLLPADLYRDMDGRRNKGTVLRLSVNYILELRHALSQTVHLRQETAIARQLIPSLLSHMQRLEGIIKEIVSSRDRSDLPEDLLNHFADDSAASFESTLEAWRATMEANVSRYVPEMSSPVGDPALGKTESQLTPTTSTAHTVSVSSSNIRSLPLLENVQISFMNRSFDQVQHLQSAASTFGDSDGLLKQESMEQEEGQENGIVDHETVVPGDAYHHLTSLRDASDKTDDHNEFDLEKSTVDLVDSFYDAGQTHEFSEMIRRSTDCVQSIRPVECQNR